MLAAEANTLAPECFPVIERLSLHNDIRYTAPMMARASVILALLVFPALGQAQFQSGWTKHPYWSDGKAEFNIYAAKEVRYGKQHESEVIHILVQEPFSPMEMVKTEDTSLQGAFNVLKMNQVIRVPTGIYVYQQMASFFWRSASSELIKFSLTSNDSCGNTFKLGESVEPRQWFYEFNTYWEGMSAGEEQYEAPAEGYLYDELPFRVRTIDFSNEAGEFVIQLAPTIISSKAGPINYATARVKWAREKERINVSVSHAAGNDEFELGPAFPHPLRKWNKADGSVLELKENLKIDYWKYNRPGDRERALEAGRAAMEAAVEQYHRR